MRDRTGEPVPGAGIWVSERYLTNLGHVVTRADEHGAFTLRAIGPDHYVGAQKAGFAPSGLRSVPGAPGDRIELELVLAEGGATLDLGRIALLELGPAAAPVILSLSPARR